MGGGMGCSAQKIALMYRTVSLRSNFILLLSILLSCSGKKQEQRLPYYNTPEFTPEFFDTEKEAREKITHTIPSFSFTDQNGKQVTEKDIEGKIHAANFIFTRCGSICPIMTKHMKLVQDAFKSNTGVVLLSYSVTPWIDSVGRLKNYADNNGITAANWHLLTGNKGDIYTLARQSYFAEEDLGFTKDSTDFLHTEHILLVDKAKRIRGIYNGTLQLEMEQMIKDMEALLKEKGEPD
jgi:protein SCO1